MQFVWGVSLFYASFLHQNKAKKKKNLQKMQKMQNNMTLSSEQVRKHCFSGRNIQQQQQKVCKNNMLYVTLYHLKPQGSISKLGVGAQNHLWNRPWVTHLEQLSTFSFSVQQTLKSI